MACEVSPGGSVPENIEQVALAHAGLHFHLERRQPLGRGISLEFLQMRHAVSVNGQLGVGRKADVYRRRGRCQFLPQLRDKLLSGFGKIEGFTIMCQPRFAIRPGQELRSVIIEGIGANDEEITGLQGSSQMNENTNLECATVHHDTISAALCHEVLPALRGKAQVKLSVQFITACRAMFDDNRQRFEQAAILVRRMDIHQFEQAKQKTAGFGVDWPQQRQIIVVVPGADRFALFRQRLDATLLGQQSANAFPNIGVALAVFRGFQHLPQNAHQFLFDTSVLFLERFEFFLCGDLCLAHAAQQHFDQFVTTLRTDLSQKAQDQSIAPTWLGYGPQFAYLQGAGFRGKLPELGVADAIQKWIRVNQARQPFEAFCPQPDRFWARGARRLLQPVKWCCRRPFRNCQKFIKNHGGIRCHPRGDLHVHACMDLSPQMIDQSVQRAEGGQIDRGFTKGFDGSIDQVRRIAHHFSCCKHGCRNHLLCRLRKWQHTEMAAHRSSIAVEHRLLTSFIEQRRYARQIQLRRQMCDRAYMNGAERRKIAQVLTTFQQNRQCQTTGVTGRLAMNKEQISVIQVVASFQFLDRQRGAWTRIGCAVNCGHEVSGKGFARGLAKHA